jgi:S1-C subfamily serine protease
MEKERHVNKSVGVGKEEWVAVMDDGSTYSFPNKEVAIDTLNHMKKTYKRLFRKTAQVNTKWIDEALKSCVMVESSHADGTREIGAGFCIRGGLFITCAHVVGKYNKDEMPDETTHAGNIKNIVLDRNGERAPAIIVGMDLRKDIAILRSDIPSVALDLGSERDVRVGEEVFAVGSPKGFENNVSSGIISSKGRRIFWYKGAPRYIFTDAHVLPGNSGGPLISYRNKKVVGMMAMIVGADGGMYGLNVALPADEIVAFIASLGV